MDLELLAKQLPWKSLWPMHYLQRCHDPVAKIVDVEARGGAQGGTDIGLAGVR